jgi:hypothetical protein
VNKSVEIAEGPGPHGYRNKVLEKGLQEMQALASGFRQRIDDSSGQFKNAGWK